MIAKIVKIISGEKVMIDLPNYDLLVKNLSEEELAVAERFWKSLWNVYVKNKGTTSLIYWTEQFDSSMAMNKVLFILKDFVKAVVIPQRNWAEVQLDEDKLLNQFEIEELTQYRKDRKMSRYLPVFKESSATNLVRSNGQVSKTGLERVGFMKAGHTQYYYDSAMLNKYKHAVVINTNKGMTKMRQMHPDIAVDDASYDLIAEDVVDYLVDSPQLMTQGISFLDSRGRAIKESLSKLCNPIGYKDFRALLTIPQD